MEPRQVIYIDHCLLPLRSLEDAAEAAQYFSLPVLPHLKSARFQLERHPGKTKIDPAAFVYIDSATPHFIGLVLSTEEDEPILWGPFWRVYNISMSQPEVQMLTIGRNAREETNDSITFANYMDHAGHESYAGGLIRGFTGLFKLDGSSTYAAVAEPMGQRRLFGQAFWKRILQDLRAYYNETPSEDVRGILLWWPRTVPASSSRYLLEHFVPLDLLNAPVDYLVQLECVPTGFVLRVLTSFDRLNPSHSLTENGPPAPLVFVPNDSSLLSFVLRACGVRRWPRELPVFEALADAALVSNENNEDNGITFNVNQFKVDGKRFPRLLRAHEYADLMNSLDPNAQLSASLFVDDMNTHASALDTQLGEIRKTMESISKMMEPAAAANTLNLLERFDSVLGEDSQIKKWAIESKALLDATRPLFKASLDALRGIALIHFALKKFYSTMQADSSHATPDAVAALVDSVAQVQRSSNISASTSSVEDLQLSMKSAIADAKNRQTHVPPKSMVKLFDHIARLVQQLTKAATVAMREGLQVDTKKRLDEIQAELDAAQQMRAELEAERAKAAEDLQALRQRTWALNSQIDRKDRDMASLQTQLTSAMADTAALRERLAAELDQTTTIAQLNERVASLTAELETQESRARHSQRRLAKLLSGRDKLESQRKLATAVNEDAANLGEMLEQAAPALDENEQRVKQLVDEVNGLTQKAVVLAEQLNESNRSLATMRAQYESERNANATEMAAVREQLQKLQTDKDVVVAELEGRLAEAMSAIQVIRDEGAAATAREQQRASEIGAQLTLAMSKLDVLQQRVAETIQQRDQLREQLTNVTSERDEQKRDKESLLESNRQLRLEKADAIEAGDAEANRLEQELERIDRAAMEAVERLQSTISELEGSKAALSQKLLGLSATAQQLEVEKRELEQVNETMSRELDTLRSTSEAAIARLTGQREELEAERARSEKEHADKVAELEKKAEEELLLQSKLFQSKVDFVTGSSEIRTAALQRQLDELQARFSEEQTRSAQRLTELDAQLAEAARRHAEEITGVTARYSDTIEQKNKEIARLETLNKTYEEQLQDWDTRTQSLIEENELEVNSLTARVQELEQQHARELDALTQIANKRAEEIVEHETKIRELTEQMRSRTEEHEQAVKDLQTRMTASEEAAKELERRHSERVAELEQRIQELEAINANAIKERDTTVATLRAELARSKSRIRDLEEGLRRYKAETERLVYTLRDYAVDTIDPSGERGQMPLEEAFERITKTMQRLRDENEALTQQLADTGRRLNNLQSANSKLGKKNADLSSALVQTQDELGSVNMDLLTVRKEATRLTQLSDGLQKALDASKAAELGLGDRVRELEAEIGKQKTGYEALLASKTSLEAELADSAKTVARLTADLAASGKENDAHLQKIKQMNEQIVSATVDRDKLRDELAAQSALLKQKEAEWKLESAKAADDLRKLRLEIDSRLREITKNEETIKDLREQLDSERSTSARSAAAYTKQIEDLTKENARLLADVATGQRQINSLEQQLKDARADYDRLRNTYNQTAANWVESESNWLLYKAKAEESTKLLQQRVANLQAELNEANRNLAREREAVARLNDRLRAEKAERDRLQRELADENRKVAELVARNKDKDEEINHLNRDVNVKKAEIGRLKKELAQARSDNVTLRQQLTKLGSVLETTRNQLEDANLKAARAKEQLDGYASIQLERLDELAAGTNVRGVARMTSLKEAVSHVSSVVQDYNFSNIAKQLAGRRWRMFRSYFPTQKSASAVAVKGGKADTGRVIVMEFFDQNDEIIKLEEYLTRGGISTIVSDKLLAHKVLDALNGLCPDVKISRPRDRIPVYMTLDGNVEPAAVDRYIGRTVALTPLERVVQLDIQTRQNLLKRSLKKGKLGGDKELTELLARAEAKATDKGAPLFSPILFSSSQEKDLKIEERINRRYAREIVPMFALVRSDPDWAKLDNPAVFYPNFAMVPSDKDAHWSTRHDITLEVLRDDGKKDECNYDDVSKMRGTVPVSIYKTGWIRLHADPDLWSHEDRLIYWDIPDDETHIGGLVTRVVSLMSCIVAFTAKRQSADWYDLQSVFVLPQVVDVDFVVKSVETDVQLTNAKILGTIYRYYTASRAEKSDEPDQEILQALIDHPEHTKTLLFFVKCIQQVVESIDPVLYKQIEELLEVADPENIVRRSATQLTGRYNDINVADAVYLGVRMILLDKVDPSSYNLQPNLDMIKFYFTFLVAVDSWFPASTARTRDALIKLLDMPTWANLVMVSPETLDLFKTTVTWFEQFSPKLPDISKRLEWIAKRREGVRRLLEFLQNQGRSATAPDTVLKLLQRTVLAVPQSFEWILVFLQALIAYAIGPDDTKIKGLDNEVYRSLGLKHFEKWARNMTVQRESADYLLILFFYIQSIHSRGPYDAEAVQQNFSAMATLVMYLWDTGGEEGMASAAWLLRVFGSTVTRGLLANLPRIKNVETRVLLSRFYVRLLRHPMGPDPKSDVDRLKSHLRSYFNKDKESAKSLYSETIKYFIESDVLFAATEDFSDKEKATGLAKKIRDGLFKQPSQMGRDTFALLWYTANIVARNMPSKKDRVADLAKYKPIATLEGTHVDEFDDVDLPDLKREERLDLPVFFLYAVFKTFSEQKPSRWSVSRMFSSSNPDDDAFWKSTEKDFRSWDIMAFAKAFVLVAQHYLDVKQVNPTRAQLGEVGQMAKLAASYINLGGLRLP